MKMLHRRYIEKQNSRLEIRVRILHAQFLFRIPNTLAILHIQVPKIIGIKNRRKKIIAKLRVVQLGHIRIDHQIGVKVKHLLIVRENRLYQETVICLSADMGISFEFVSANQMRNIIVKPKSSGTFK